MTAKQLRCSCALALLAVSAGMASAHWLRPEEIVADLANDPQLRQRVGVTGVHNDPKLPRLLIVNVRRGVWQSVPETERVRLAEEWLDTWRHNVPEGIVAVLDAATQQSLVNFDGLGHARLPQLAPAATPPQPGVQNSPR